MVFNFSFNMVIYYDHDNRKGPLPSFFFCESGALAVRLLRRCSKSGDGSADHIWGESSADPSIKTSSSRPKPSHFTRGLVNVPFFWGLVSHHRKKYVLEMKSPDCWVMFNWDIHQLLKITMFNGYIMVYQLFQLPFSIANC